jgi:integrase
MPTAKLSKRTADTASPSAKPYVLYDEALHGFGLRVMPSGHKTWVVEYRPTAGGRRASSRRMSLGSAATVTADEARKQARDTLAAVRLGQDPARKIQVSRSMPTFSEIGEQFIEQVCVPGKLKPNTIRLYKRNIRKLAAPQIGTLAIDAVTKPHVTRLHRKIGRTRPTTANNLLVTISSVFKFAVEEGYLPEGTNPASGVEKYKTKAMERYLNSEELARLGEAIRVGETVGLAWAKNELKNPAKAKHRPKKPENTVVVIPPDVAAALRLLIFTGCRKMEILGLRWSEVDFERGMLNIEDSKTGRRVVILNAPALAILAAQPRTNYEFVFPGADPTSFRKDITGYWYRVRQHAGLDGKDGSAPLRLHDLRHSFASFGVSGGMGLPIVGKLLGHTQAATTSRYAHLDADPVRRASESIGAGIAAAMGEPTKKPGSVLPLRGDR